MNNPNLIQEAVYEQLDNAIENEFDFNDWTLQEIAEDLLDLGDFDEDVDTKDLIPFIQSWVTLQGA